VSLFKFWVTDLKRACKNSEVWYTKFWFWVVSDESRRRRQWRHRWPSSPATRFSERGERLERDGVV
jgi:hypothetical protein